MASSSSSSSSSSSERRAQILRPANSNFLPSYTEEKLRPFLLEDEVPRIIRKPASVNINNHEALRWKAIHILDSVDHNAFEEFITNLDSSRVNKHLYNFCRTNYPNALSMKLSYLLLHSHNPQVKSKCANLLHLFLENSSYWSSTSHVARGQLKIVILEILKQDNPKEICKKVWMTASHICRRGILERRGVWQDMLSLFYESLNSDVSYVQDCAVMFFVALPGCLREELSQNIENLRLKLLNKFNSSNGKRKVVALGALVNLVHHMSSDYYSQFDDLLMPMIKGVMDFVDNVEEDNVQRSIKKLVELVGPHARFFDSHLNQLFDALITIGGNDRLGDETRYLAIEMMSAFDDISIKSLGYEILERLSFALIWMISLIPDGSMDYILGIDFMERISMVRGDELCMPVLLEKIQKDIASSEWRRRFAAVTFIRVTAKGCAKDMTNNLALVMNVVLKSLLDSSFSVRHAAIVTVKVMSLELPPHTLDQHADLLITSLYLALADDRNPLKQAAAASAMGPLCDSCSSCILEPRLHTIVNKLLQLIQSPSVDLQAESLKALASVARSSKDLFCEYYELVITCLKKVLVDATSVSVQDNAVELQLDDAVECIWTVAMTVGKNIFKKDAAEVVILMLSVRWYLAEDDRGSKVTFIRAWKQLLRCLGSKDFYPYVNDIMPTLLRSARLGSSGNEKSAPERYILWEKLKACKLLLRLTKQFKGKFFPWIDQVSDILVPLVTFQEKDIRKLAFSAMPKLLLSAKLSIENKQAHGLTNSYLHKLVLRIVPSLVDALNKETDGEICVKILKSLNKCSKVAAPFLSEKKIQRIANAIEQILIAISRKHFTQEENVTELEKEIIKKVVIYFRILINIYEDSSWTFVDKFLELIKAMMGNDATEKDKQVALLTFNEISLKCEEAANRFYQTPIIWQRRKPNNG